VLPEVIRRAKAALLCEGVTATVASRQVKAGWTTDGALAASNSLMMTSSRRLSSCLSPPMLELACALRVHSFVHSFAPSLTQSCIDRSGYPSIHPSIHAFVDQFLFAPEFFPRVTHVDIQKGNKHVQHGVATHTAIYGQYGECRR